MSPVLKKIKLIPTYSNLIVTSQKRQLKYSALEGMPVMKRIQ